MMKIFVDEEAMTLQGISMLGTCHGNLTAIARLTKGRPLAEVVKALGGIGCGRRGTSCPDQIAKALQMYIDGKVGPGGRCFAPDPDQTPSMA